MDLIHLRSEEEPITGLVPKEPFTFLVPSPADISYVSTMEPGTQAPGNPSTPKAVTNNGMKQSIFGTGPVESKAPVEPPSLLKPLLWAGAGLLAFQLLT